MQNKLVIHSVNPDINGVWLRKDVEQEMKEVECPPMTNTDWIVWVLDHQLDSITTEIENVICSEYFEKINLKLPEGKTTIEVY